MTLIPEKFRKDYELMFREPLTARRFFANVVPRGSVLVMYFGRLGESSGFIGRIASFLYLLMSRRRGIELNYARLQGGGGIIFAHAYAITVNDSAKLAGDLILFKGCTIGGVRGGPRRGVPVIGRHVVVGLNATVVGGITVGDDVFIAPNAFVNFDVPSHSLVIGNPGVIHHKECATKGYFVDV